MSVIFQFVFHLSAVALAIGALHAMRAAGQPHKRILVAAWPLTLAIGTFGFMVSEPRWIFADFIMGYHRGGVAVLQGPGALGAVLGPDIHGFVNLPILAYLFCPLSLLPPMIAGYMWLALGVVSLVIAWEMLSRLAHLDTFGRALLLVLVGSNGPTLYGLREGNTSQFVLVVLLVALVFIRKGRLFLAGLLLGAMAAIKLPLLLFGVYYTIRQRWAVVAGGGTILVVIFGMSLLVFGWDFNVRWYESCVAPYSSNPLPAFNVQSVASFFARLQTGRSGIMDWRPHELSLPLKIASKAAVAVLFGVTIVVGILARRKQGVPTAVSRAEILEFAIIMTLACVASPLAWSHYFLWLLMPLALFLDGSAFAPRDRLRRIALWLAIALTIPLCRPLELTGLAGKFYVLSVSSYLYAALIFLVLLWWARWKPETFSAQAAEIHIK